MPSVFPVKCASPWCHRRVKLNAIGIKDLREEQARAAAEGATAGLICPQCLKRAFDDPDAWAFEMPIGELMVEAAKESPRWRYIIEPARNGNV